MSRPMDLDQRIDAFFADGPGRAPDHLLGQSLRAAASERQVRRPWWPRRLDRGLRRDIGLVLLGAGAALGLGFLLVRGGIIPPGPTDSAAPGATPSASARQRPASATNGAIAFTVGADQTTELATMNARASTRVHMRAADGTGDREIGVNDEPSSCAAYSPDGSRLAYWTGHETSALDLVIASADGSSARLIPGTANLSQDEQPVWSPDGSRIAYVPWDGSEIDIVDAAGGSLSVVAPGLGYLRTPRWSPDGASMAVVAIKSGAAGVQDDVSIVVIDIETGTARRLTAGGELGAWSPDGSWLSFTRASDPTTASPADLFIIRPDGSDERNLTQSPVSEGSPAWSPDGRWIAHVTGVGMPYAGTERLAITATDGSGTTVMDRAGELASGFVASPTWSPDGRRIAVVTFPPGASGGMLSLGRMQIVTVPVDGVGAQTVVVSQDGMWGTCGLSWQAADGSSPTPSPTLSPTTSQTLTPTPSPTQTSPAVPTLPPTPVPTVSGQGRPASPGCANGCGDLPVTELLGFRWDPVTALAPMPVSLSARPHDVVTYFSLASRAATYPGEEVTVATGSIEHGAWLREDGSRIAAIDLNGLESQLRAHVKSAEEGTDITVDGVPGRLVETAAGPDVLIVQRDRVFVISLRRSRLMGTPESGPTSGLTSILEGYLAAFHFAVPSTVGGSSQP